MRNPELRNTTKGTELTEDTETQGCKAHEGHKEQIRKICVINNELRIKLTPRRKDAKNAKY